MGMEIYQARELSGMGVEAWTCAAQLFSVLKSNSAERAFTDYNVAVIDGPSGRDRDLFLNVHGRDLVVRADQVIQKFSSGSRTILARVSVCDLLDDGKAGESYMEMLINRHGMMSLDGTVNMDVPLFEPMWHSRICQHFAENLVVAVQNRLPVIES